MEVKPDVRLKLYVTGEEPMARYAPQGALEGRSPTSRFPLTQKTTFHYRTMAEMNAPSRESPALTANVKLGKMCTSTVIPETLQGVGRIHRVLFVSCGPKALMDATHDAAELCRAKHGCTIDVHCEDFGGS